MVPDDDPLLTTTEAAKRIGVSGRTLAKWWQDGKVEPTEKTLGGHGRWRESDLRRQIREWQNRQRSDNEAPDQ
jgi:excisionase family DNA binding protein